MLPSFTAAVRSAAHFVWRRRVRASLARPDACSLFGLDLVIEPGVLHPRHFVSSLFLARHVLSLDLHGREIADIGTGSGLLALLAARSGAYALALDISPAAVGCASANARRNGLAERVEVLESDVFDAIETGRRFDLVITNPPFYPRAAQEPSDHAFASGVDHAFFVKLAAGLPGRLKPNGRLLMIHTSDTDFAPIAQLFAARGLECRVLTRRRGLFETLTIRDFRRAA